MGYSLTGSNPVHDENFLNQDGKIEEMIFLALGKFCISMNIIADDINSQSILIKKITQK